MRIAPWLIVLGLLSAEAEAQQPRFPLVKLGVDMVTIKGGHRLLGAITKRDDKQVEIVVERTWLKRTLPKLYASYADKELAQWKALRGKKLERYKAWKERRNEDVGLQVYIDKQLGRLSQPDDKLPNTSEYQFMQIRLEPSQVVRHFVQPAQRRRYVLVAWGNRLNNVTTRSVASLARELREKKIELADVDLRSRLPNWSGDDKSWHRHVALVEYRLRRQLNFQGTDDFLVQTGDKAQASDLEKIFTRMLTDEVNSKLAQLLNKGGAKKDATAWRKTATDGAREAGVSGVRVARLRQNITTGKVEVTITFLAAMPDGTWEAAYDHTMVAAAGQQDADRRKRVAVSPEVQKVLEIAKAAGLNPNDKKIQLALQFGAAAEQAQTKALRRFEDHLTELIGK